MSRLVLHLIVATLTFLVGVVCSNFLTNNEFSVLQPKHLSEADLPRMCDVHNIAMYWTQVRVLHEGLCPNLASSERFKESQVFYPNSGFRLLKNDETIVCGTENLTRKGYVCWKCRAMFLQRESFSDGCIEHSTTTPNAAVAPDEWHAADVQ